MEENQQFNGITKQSQLHLYLAWGCPFCHRVTAALAVTGLSDKFTLTWMENVKPKSGWQISPDADPLFGATSLDEVYDLLGAKPEQPRSVPLLVERDSKTLLSTESMQIVRLISKGINGLYLTLQDLVPDHLVDKIDHTNQWLHINLNRAVYLVGFAEQEADYQLKRTHVFNTLDRLDAQLQQSQFLLGDWLTESDLFLYATLLRFDDIYYTLFRCNLKRLSSYANLTVYKEKLGQLFGLNQTYQAQLTVEHYYLSTMHVNGQVRELNPSKTLPKMLSKVLA